MPTRKDYEKIIKSLNFHEILAIKKNFKKGYYIIRGDIKGRDVLLKVVPKKDWIRAKLIKKEMLVDDIIEKHNVDLTKPLVLNARVLGIGHDNKYLWIIRRFYPGKSLARVQPKKVMLGYDRIRANFIHESHRIIKQIVDNIESVQSITNDFRRLGIKKEYFDRYFGSEIENLIENGLEKKLGITLSEHVKFYNNHKKNYLSKRYKCASVTDLSPSNIIIKDNGVVVFSDLELFSFDNYTMDIAYLWLFLWRYPDWQKKLVSLSIKNNIDRQFFRISVIRIILSKYKFPSVTAGIKSDSGIIIFFKKHAWYKYLIAAGESFEGLTKVNKKINR